MRILSLGAGVQSSTLLLMAVERELALDGAIFADTGWEPRAVYAHLDWLATVSPVPLTRVSAGDLRADVLASKGRFATIPLYARTPTAPVMLRRQCTKQYKIVPIRRALRSLGATAASPATLVYGISLDEWQRSRTSDVQYIVNEYPLIDRGLTRTDCLHWLAGHGYPEPPKSACIGCPYHSDAQWRQSQRETPDEWADAVAFDHALRDGRRVGQVQGVAYLHRTMEPLDTIDLRSAQDRGQLDLFGAECAGVCGV